MAIFHRGTGQHIELLINCLCKFLVLLVSLETWPDHRVPLTVDGLPGLR